MKTELTVEESARLVECGVDKKRMVSFNVGADNEEWNPIFTLSDLLSILPKKITDRRNIYILEISVGDCDSGWNIRYRDRLTGIDDLDTYQESRELIDAIYAMLIWLKSNPELVWL